MRGAQNRSAAHFVRALKAAHVSAAGGQADGALDPEAAFCVLEGRKDHRIARCSAEQLGRAVLIARVCLRGAEPVGGALRARAQGGARVGGGRAGGGRARPGGV